MFLFNYLDLLITSLVIIPILVDNFITSETNLSFQIKPNSTILDDLDSFIFLVHNWIKSVAADEGHQEIGLICIIVFWLPSLVNVLLALAPFINENTECDTMLLLADVLFVSLGFVFIIAPIFSYFSITSSVTWTVPIIFNLFLPLIELIGKLIRAINIALRLSSNLTAGHLLMLLISTFSEFLISSSNYLLKFLGLVIYNFSIVVTVLESFLICIQTYVWSILVLYYINQDE